MADVVARKAVIVIAKDAHYTLGAFDVEAEGQIQVTHVHCNLTKANLLTCAKSCFPAKTDISTIFPPLESASLMCSLCAKYVGLQDVHNHGISYGCPTNTATMLSVYAVRDIGTSAVALAS